MGGFTDSLPTKETPYAHPGGYLFPVLWSVKLPEGEEMLNEIYALRKQRDNLCCAVERGCCHFIIKLRCGGQMWNLDNELYRATWLGLWLASQAEQGELHELQATQNASVTSSHLPSSDHGCIWPLHPVISPLLIQVSHEEHPHTLESPGCLETQVVCYCPSPHVEALFLTVFPGKESFSNMISFSFYF